MKDIAIYGAGGFGREVVCLINAINKQAKVWNFIGFFDDGKEKGTKNEYGEVLGGIEELNNIDKPLSIVIAIATPKIVRQLVENIKSPLIEFPNLIAPDVIFLDKDNVEIGKGNIFGFGCSLSINVSIGNYNIFNGGISVGHDTKITDFNSIMPAVKISGEVVIGSGNYFGVNSTILQQISIGNDTVIGANSLIIRKTKDGKTYVGSPATIIKY